MMTCRLFRLISGLAFGLLAFTPAHVWATTYTVTNTSDSGTGSLRGAIASAQNGDTVVFHSGVSGTITLASALTITNSITIQGPGATALAISGNNSVPVFEVSSGTSASPVTLSGLTIEKGYNLPPYSGYGGGVAVAGGAAVTLTACTLDANTSYYEGGGLYNSTGTVRLTNCTLSGNIAQNGNGGGLDNAGGTATLTGCTLSGNSAVSGDQSFDGYGGGLDNAGGTVTLTACTLSGNSSTNGGGIENDTGAVTLTNCVVSGNSVSLGEGGGLANYATAALTNCTFTANSANNGGADGLFNYGTLTLTNDIFFGDGGSEIQNHQAAATAAFCDIGETIGSGGDGVTDNGHNINANPLFVNAPANVAIQNGSPCVGAGTSSGAPSTDITGLTRLSPPSIGAFDVTTRGTKHATAITLTPSRNPSVVGQSVTFTAAIAPTSGTGIPTGTVTFTVDGTGQSPVALSSGSATYTTSAFTQGSHTVAAAYSGDSTYAASATSSALTQTVNAAAPPTVIHTFPAGLQMISFTENYAGISNPWAAPATQPLDLWNGTTYVLTTTLPAPGHGAWVNLGASTAVYDTGTPVTGMVSVPLSAGWNLVGDPFSAPVVVSGLSASSGGTTYTGMTAANQHGLLYTTLYTYPNPGGTTPYKSLGTSDSLQPFAGYWMYAFQPCALLISAPAASGQHR